MSERKLIGKVSATEKYPSSCDDFQFWISDEAVLSPFNIVCVENRTDGSITYGVVQDILHITDGTRHISNYVSSDFGDVSRDPMTHRLALSYPVSKLRSMPCPDEFKEILPFYLLKYRGEEPPIEVYGKQLSLLEDGDIFDDEM